MSFKGIHYFDVHCFNVSHRANQVFSRERIYIIVIVATRDPDTFRVEGQFEILRQLIAKLKVDIVLLLLQILEEPELTLTKFKVALDGSGEAVAYKAKIDEARAHGHLFRSKGVSVVACAKLLRLVNQWGPFYIVLFMLNSSLFLCHQVSRGHVILGSLS